MQEGCVLRFRPDCGHAPSRSRGNHHGCQQNPSGTAGREATDRGSDRQPGAVSAWSRPSSRKASCLDVGDQRQRSSCKTPRTAAGQQEQVNGSSRRRGFRQRYRGSIARRVRAPAGPCDFPKIETGVLQFPESSAVNKNHGKPELAVVSDPIEVPDPTYWTSFTFPSIKITFMLG